MLELLLMVLDLINKCLLLNKQLGAKDFHLVGDHVLCAVNTSLDFQGPDLHEPEALDIQILVEVGELIEHQEVPVDVLELLDVSLDYRASSSRRFLQIPELFLVNGLPAELGFEFRV